MLAKTFKTHEELGLLKHEYDALVTTLYMIEDGEIKPELIYMRAFTEQLGCGTAHCLAGWAHVVDINAFPEISPNQDGYASDTLRMRLPYPLQKLFYLLSGRYPDTEAPARLRTYLETGTCE